MIASGTSLEAAAGALVAGVLAVWLILSVLNYYKPFGRWMGRYDSMLLIPQWTFFAPLPNRADYFFFVRTLSPEGIVSHWKEVVLARDRSWAAFVWNPDRRIRKGFFDLVAELCTMSSQPRPEILLSLPYLHLLCVAASSLPPGSSDRFQFAVSRSVPSQPETGMAVLFCSEFHSLNVQDASQWSSRKQPASISASSPSPSPVS